MNRVWTWGAAAILTLVACAGSARAQDNAIRYALADDTNLSIGCVEPCKCPVYWLPVRGTVTLTPRETDPLFQHYAVEKVDWEIPRFDGGVLRVKGSGRYRIGGEFALVHQLELDLQVGEQPPQHFDSGIVVGGVNFPRIDIAVAVNGFFCYDSIFTVLASPTVSVIDVTAETPLMVRPNPFHAGTEIALALAEPNVVDLRVLDVAGREVSALVESSLLSAGSHVFVWSGRSNEGRISPPGVYFVRADVDGRRSLQRVAKLD